MKYSQEKIIETKIKYFGKGDDYKNANLTNTKINEDKIFEKTSNWMNESNRILLLCGPSGTGKTYHVASILEDLMEEFNIIKFFKSRELFSKFNILKNYDYTPFLFPYLESDLLIVDDLGDERPYDLEFKKEMIYKIVDHRVSHKLPMIITTILNEEQWSEIYSQPICSRLFSRENEVIYFTSQPNYFLEPRT